MAQLKKFLFDNFIIETKPEADVPADDSEELLCAAEELNVETEAQPEPQKTEFEEKIVEYEPVEEEPAEKSYLQSEVDEMLNAARQEGCEQGMRSSQQGLEAETNTLLADISQKLTVLLSDAGECRKEVENQALEMVKAVVAKLVPTLMEQQAAELVSGFIADNFNNFKDEAKLSFYIHPDIISYAQEKIASLANSYDFEGKIALHKDSSLAKNDCRIEWENGGVELNGADQLAKVTALLDNGEDIKPEIKHDR